MSRYVDIEPYKKNGWRLTRNRTEKNTSYIEGADLDIIPTTDIQEVITETDVKKWCAKRNYALVAKEDFLGIMEVGHGHWIEDRTEPLGYRCSICGKGMCKFNFCPYCGASMDEVAE